MKLYPNERKKISLNALHGATQPPVREKTGVGNMAKMENLEHEIVRLRVAETAIRQSRQNLEAQLRKRVIAEALAGVEAVKEIGVEAPEEEPEEEAEEEPVEAEPEEG